MLQGGRIVLAGEFWFGATGSGIANGLRALNWDVGEVDLREFLICGKTPAMRVAARVLGSAAAASYNRAVLDAVDRVRPAWFLCVKGSYLTPQTLSVIRRAGVATANFYPDFHFDFGNLDLQTLPYYDVFATTKSFHIDYLAKHISPKNIRFIHHGYSGRVHRPRMPSVAETEFLADVLYVGSHSDYKERWLTEVAHRMPGVRFLVAGGGWRRIAKGGALPIKFTEGDVTGDFYARLIQRARINLAIHSGPLKPGGWEDLVSTRTFEIPACKGFMLHIDNHEVRTLFTPGKEIDVFGTPEELADKVAHYLADGAQRRDMLEQAFDRCVPEYSYDERARSLVEAFAERRRTDIGQMSGRPRPTTPEES